MGRHHSRKRGRRPHGATQGRNQRNLVCLERPNHSYSWKQHCRILPDSGTAPRHRICAPADGRRSLAACAYHVSRSNQRLRPEAHRKMRRILSAAAILVLAAPSALAHRLDEYLQGAIIAVEKTRVDVELTLTPGVAVFPRLIVDIDTDGNGVVSTTEQQAYVGRILRDLTLKIDGQPLTSRLLSMEFPAIGEMKEGRGEIRIEFESALPAGGPNRKLTLEN